MDRNAPIGIFDSGVGGLTVARSILDYLPGEELIYLGDTAHTPYGDKDLFEVRKYALAIMDYLASQQVKMLVIACNTASCAILEEAYQRYQVEQGIEVVEVIRPAVKQAAEITQSGLVGVIGTNATIGSGIYQQQLAKCQVQPFAQACPRYVQFAEQGITTGEELIRISRQYLSALIEANVDTLILGCTHYPLLRGPISYLMGSKVRLVSSSNASAMEVYARLVAQDMTRIATVGPKHRFICTSYKDSFDQLAGRVMGSSYRGIKEESLQ